MRARLFRIVVRVYFPATHSQAESERTNEGKARGMVMENEGVRGLLECAKVDLKGRTFFLGGGGVQNVVEELTSIIMNMMSHTVGMGIFPQLMFPPFSEQNLQDILGG